MNDNVLFDSIFRSLVDCCGCVMAPQSFFTQRLALDEDKFRLDVPQHSDPVLPRQGYVSLEVKRRRQRA